MDVKNAGNPKNKETLDNILAYCKNDANISIKDKLAGIDGNLADECKNIYSDNKTSEEQKIDFIIQAGEQAEQEKKDLFNKVEASSKQASEWVDNYKKDNIDSPGTDDNFGEGSSNIGAISLGIPGPVISEPFVANPPKTPVSKETKNKEEPEPKDPKDPGEGGPTGSAVADISPENISEDTQEKKRLDENDFSSPDFNSENKVSIIDRFTVIVLCYLGPALVEVTDIFMQVS